MIKTAITCIYVTSICLSLPAQEHVSLEAMFAYELMVKDSIIYNSSCDTSSASEVISEDFEYYQDDIGLFEAKRSFISGIYDQCRNLDTQHSISMILDSTVLITPILENNKIEGLVGLVHTGKRQNILLEEGKAKHPAVVTRFYNVWRKEQGGWKLYRMINIE